MESRTSRFKFKWGCGEMKTEINELKKLNCEIANGDNKFNRYEDFISLKNKINLIIREINTIQKGGIKE
jgi:hypothetical protein